jgi:hypothetical protein
MTRVKVIPHGDKWRVVTEAMENPIGPRLWGAEPPNGLPPADDIFDDKQNALDAARLWNAYSAWAEDRSGKRKKCSKLKRTA